MSDACVMKVMKALKIGPTYKGEVKAIVDRQMAIQAVIGKEEYKRIYKDKEETEKLMTDLQKSIDSIQNSTPDSTVASGTTKEDLTKIIDAIESPYDSAKATQQQQQADTKQSNGIISTGKTSITDITSIQAVLDKGICKWVV